MGRPEFKEEEYNTNSFDAKLWLKVFKLLKEEKKYFFWMGLANLIVALIDILYPVLNKEALDYFVNGEGSNKSITTFIVVYMICILIQGVGCFIFFYLAGSIEMGFSYNTRKKMISKLQELPYSYYDNHPSGWLMARCSSDVAQLSEIMSWDLMDIVWSGTIMIGVSIMMFINDWKLALMVLAVMPVLFYLSKKFDLKLLISYREVRKTNSKITSSFSEGIAGAKTTKTLVLEKHHDDEFEELTKNMYDKSVNAAIYSALFRPLVLGLNALVISFVIWYGGSKVLAGLMEFGTLYLFSQNAQQFFEPLHRVSELLAELQLAQASAERVVSLIDEDPKIKDKPEVVEKYGTILNPKKENYELIKGDIEFKNIDFSYLPEEPILKNFNLKVKAGQMIALVGETGSGKSTIVNLLCRFYEPVRGEILIDGIDYRERSLGWLHENLGYVLQSPQLFPGTIADNIRYGKLEATDEEVIEAAKYVNAHEFISNLEDGYNTDVGENGGRLSTGEKQLISFARALIRKPSIYVLDEATSSIDTETEQVIQNAIETLLKGKTSFVIAHRLSTIVSADRILVIKKGQIIEDGTHSELMKLKGYYYRLYTNQFNEQQQNELLHFERKKQVEEIEKNYDED